jgi:hypothetical protein
MKENIIVEAAAEPVALLPLAELAGEGFGWGGAYVRSPLDAVDALAADLVGRGVEVLWDDLGRRCVSRNTARELFAERAAAKERGRQLQAENEATAGVPRGAPALPGASALESMLAASPPDSPKRRQSVLEHALANTGQLMYEPIRDDL